MHYHIKDTGIICPCIDRTDGRSIHPVSSIHYCSTCNVRRCFWCRLHTPAEKKCLRCKRDYESKDTHCYRCYTCPECDMDLVSYPLSYKSKHNIDGLKQFELISSKNDKSKIIGKAVYFKCTNEKCKYKFTTKVETKPQTLQQIVQNNIKNDTEVRFEELTDYVDWCIGYHRILDKKQRMKWKNQILSRFDSFEVAKILQGESHLQQLTDKENDIIKVTKDDDTGNKSNIYPKPKFLHTETSESCPSCLGDITSDKMSFRIPLVYSVPVVGYLPSKVQDLRFGEYTDVPILITFINESDDDMSVNIIATDSVISAASNTLNIPHMSNRLTRVDEFENVPTCLLPHIISQNECKSKTLLRDPEIIKMFEYREDFKYEFNKDVLDLGINWLTTLVVVRVRYNDNTNDGKIFFCLNLDVGFKQGNINLEYYCKVLL